MRIQKEDMVPEIWGGWEEQVTVCVKERGITLQEEGGSNAVDFENGFLLMDREEASNNNNKHIIDVSSITVRGISSY